MRDARDRLRTRPGLLKSSRRSDSLFVNGPVITSSGGVMTPPLTVIPPVTGSNWCLVVPVEIGENDVSLGRDDMGGRGQAELGLEHAADHAAEVGAICDVGDPDGVQDPAAFMILMLNWSQASARMSFMASRPEDRLNRP